MTRTKLEIVKAHLRAIETGDTETVINAFAAGAIQTEWPNRLESKGDQRSIERMAVDFERGKKILAAQSYEILHHAEAGDYLIMEVLWRGELAVEIGSLPVGAQMVAHCAIAFEFKNGKITAQRNYDCFEPF
ncbi:MAG: nuclear transport factor 2 family protein [Proteobacteria bacterium]|nr:nuclear transport factor 2 family protein [Pseudomonadota bacterium]